MKQYCSFLLCILFLFPLSAVLAQTATLSATATPVKNKQVEDLKERLATKVAQLSQTERRAIYGTVKATTISTLTIETATKDIKIELTDDITVFQMLKGKRTKLTIEDVSKGDIVTVFGEWDTAVEVLKAKSIFIHNASDALQHVVGTIMETKKSDYTITIKTKKEETYIIDFETTTKTTVWSKDAGMEKGGFSKLLPGDMIIVTGTAVPKKENRISAVRILNIGNPTGEKPTPTPTESSLEKSGEDLSPSPTSAS